MNTYIALLRGINVSGQRMIAMKDLKALLIKAGYEGVMTYIQSGNIVFKSAETNKKTLQKDIAEIIEKHYNFAVPILVLTAEEVEKIIKKNPYNDSKKDATKLHVTFLDSMPEKKLLETTRDEKFQSDEFHIDNTIIYLYCPDGYGMTKFSTMFFERKLAVTATTRSWKTLLELEKLATIKSE
ncbi:DUF1697 domain-containing protein [Candidatus Gracilibacteria bacterium]|nr:DUF1697 domain-containing protein [Candidatus Gracilibacteria bacterium]